jgi:hypothetical protein
MQRRVLATVGMTLLAASCNAGEIADPTLLELKGEWTMSWTESGTGLTCAWSGVSLSIREASNWPAGYWGEGKGSCDGLIENDNLRLFRFVIDSVTVVNGRIRFTPRDTNYQFEGRVTTHEMQGGMKASLYHAAVDADVPTTGRWRAVRVPAPQ